MEELLSASAPLALQVAPGLCRRSAGDGHSCSWYHGVWQYFRLLGIVGSPWQQRVFFENSLGELAEAGGYDRVLITGASDYSMLALALHAYRQKKVTPEITVVDRCQTPLFLNNWFADRQAIAINTRAGDFLNYDAEEAFDVVCTHSFMGNFLPDRLNDLVASWRKQLRSGGKLVTVNRLRPAARGRQCFTPGQAENFLHRALAAGRLKQDGLGLSLETLTEWVSVYTSRYETYPLTSQDVLRDALQANGFVIDRFQLEDTSDGRSSGPSAADRAMRLSLVATRA